MHDFCSRTCAAASGNTAGSRISPRTQIRGPFTTPTPGLCEVCCFISTLSARVRILTFLTVLPSQTTTNRERQDSQLLLQALRCRCKEHSGTPYRRFLPQSKPRPFRPAPYRHLRCTSHSSRHWHEAQASLTLRQSCHVKPKQVERGQIAYDFCSRRCAQIGPTGNQMGPIDVPSRSQSQGPFGLLPPASPPEYCNVRYFKSLSFPLFN